MHINPCSHSFWMPYVSFMTKVTHGDVSVSDEFCGYEPSD